MDYEECNARGKKRPYDTPISEVRLLEQSFSIIRAC